MALEAASMKERASAGISIDNRYPSMKPYKVHSQ